MIRITILSILILFSLLSCTKDEENDNSDEMTSLPNILLIIADDLGKDAISGYSEGNTKPNTPHIDGIRTSGITFNNLWVYPTCSPTRASVITGKYGYRTGVKWAGDALNNSEEILQQYIKTQTNNEYVTAVVGKWHLADESNSTFNPESLGMDYYAGLLPGGAGYTQWMLSEDGQNKIQNTYITEKFTDLAINWIEEQEKPWFMWLAYTAPHVPFHLPPTEMHSHTELPEYAEGMDALPYYHAAIEAMDYQIGRLLESMPEEERANTTIIFLGDNGTPNQVAQAPYSNVTAKGSLYQGGINMPLFISGAQVLRNDEENSLINSTDLFATIIELTGITLPEIHDSKSFKSLLSRTSSHRDYIYSEMEYGTRDMWTIRNDQYKIIIDANGGDEMYDLSSDPYENNNLIEGELTVGQVEAKSALEIFLSEIRR